MLVQLEVIEERVLVGQVEGGQDDEQRNVEGYSVSSAIVGMFVYRQLVAFPAERCVSEVEDMRTAYIIFAGCPATCPLPMLVRAPCRLLL